ncbi:MAG: hypothetical protein QM736_13755 [Vicinamibacterales bacterium]
MRALFIVLVLAAGAVIHAQQPSLDVPAVPVEQEPHHRLVFANDFIRILDVVLPPLYVSQNHTHVYDSVAVVILPGIDGPQGQARIGFAGYARGGYTHVITNPNTSPMRIVGVELREPDRGSIEELPQDEHVPVLTNAHVRITRVRLAAGETVADHQHANGYASVVVRGGDGPGTWKWHAAGEGPAPLPAGSQPLEMIEVEPR